MAERREFLLGGLAAGAFAIAEGLKPRKSVRLFSGMKLEDAVPRQIGQWQEHPGGALISPPTPNSLADRLYSATVGRVYYPRDEELPAIMLLVAYGGEQSDLLQLHRPESCYPAVGMGIRQRELTAVDLGPAAKIPAVFLSAQNDSSLEDIVYWTRLGEDLPRTASEQRSDRLHAAMRGFTGDGILVRASCIRRGNQPEWPYLAEFLKEMVRALPRNARPGFIGTRLASTIGG